MHGRTTVLVALPQPRHAASAAADVVASHGALHGPILLIEGVWTHVSAISTGDLAVFRASSTPNRAPSRGRPSRTAPDPNRACSKSIQPSNI